MSRYLTPALIVAASLSQPLTAFAQETCPQGAWFCGDDSARAPNEGSSEAIPPPPVADSLPVVEEETTVVHTREGRMPPPVVVYQPRQTSAPPTQVIIIAPGGMHVVRKAPHVHRAPVVVRKTRVRTSKVTSFRQTQPVWRSEWGLNARVEGVSFGGDQNANMGAPRDAGMGGFGLSLRYRPWARFALDAGFDVIGGTDFNGFERVETPFSLNGIFYFNPRSRTQFYAIGGVNWSSASVSSNDPSPLLTADKSGNGYGAEYKYFGGQIGVGLEFRLSKRLAFNVDMLGFMRSRTDVDDDRHGKDRGESNSTPEYVDTMTGQTTNKSGGGLFRGGVTLWW
jgi:hypothetical protein